MSSSQFPFSGDCNGHGLLNYLQHNVSTLQSSSVIDCVCFTRFSSEFLDMWTDPINGSSAVPCYISIDVVYWCYVFGAIMSSIAYIMVVRILTFWLLSGRESGLAVETLYGEIFARPRIQATVMKLFAVSFVDSMLLLKVSNIYAFPIGRQFSATFLHQCCMLASFYMSSSRVGLLILSCKDALLFDPEMVAGSDSASMLKLMLERMSHFVFACNAFCFVASMIGPVATLFPLSPAERLTVQLLAYVPVSVCLIFYFFATYHFVANRVPKLLLETIVFSISQLPPALQSESPTVLAAHLGSAGLSRSNRQNLESVLKLGDIRDEFIYSGKSNTIPYLVMGLLRLLVCWQPQLLVFMVLFECNVQSLFFAVSWRSTYRADITAWHVKLVSLSATNWGSRRNFNSGNASNVKPNSVLLANSIRGASRSVSVEPNPNEIVVQR